MKKHYLDLKDKPFYAGLCKYMSSGPVFAMVNTHTSSHSVTSCSLFTRSWLMFGMCVWNVCVQVWEGRSIVKLGRMMLGETNPADSKPGSIRGDLCIDIGR